MIATLADARRIIAAEYGLDFKFRITKACTVGVRPVYQTNVGMHMLAWRKLDAGKDSAVRIGRIHSGGQIDWEYVPACVREFGRLEVQS